MGKSKPPVSLLWEKYSFNPLTGRFHSIHGSPERTPVLRRKMPDEVIQGNTVGFMDGRLASHQLSIDKDHRYPYGVCVFAWLHGRWPEDGIHVDHINHDPFDHRPFNLQELPLSKNIRRRRAHGRIGRKRELLPGKRHSTRKPRKIHSIEKSLEIHSCDELQKVHSGNDDWDSYLEFLASLRQGQKDIAEWTERRRQARHTLHQ